MARINCTKCGQSWDTTDTGANYFFASATTYSKGDMASPKDISDAAEDMTACPKDTTAPLLAATEALGGGDVKTTGRQKYLRETASSGGAEATHR